MSGDRTSDDGSDIFWPGYVDAVTNLVLNLLFLLTIMTVAVFMFAMELGKQHTSVNAPRGESVVEEVPHVSAQDARTEVDPMPEKSVRASGWTTPRPPPILTHHPAVRPVRQQPIVFVSRNTI